MGEEIIRSRVKSFAKSWANAKDETLRPDLFTRHPEVTTRSVLAEVKSKVDAGEELIGLLQGKCLKIYRNTAEVAEVGSVPPDLALAIADFGPVVVVIDRLNSISGTANVILH